MTSEIMKVRHLLPLRYEDGPDYCTVTDKDGNPFALTVRPEAMKAMEAAWIVARPNQTSGLGAKQIEKTSNEIAGSVVERLRSHCNGDRESLSGIPLMVEAADLIQNQAAELEKLDAHRRKILKENENLLHGLIERERLITERDERIERLSELNAGLCNDFNYLLIYNSRLQDRAERMEEVVQNTLAAGLPEEVAETARVELQQEDKDV